MPQPTQYTVTTDFSADEAGGVGGRSTVRTANLDTELTSLQTTISQILTNLAILQRDDTKLRDGTVEVHTLSTAVLAMLNSSVTPRGDWVTATAYAALDLVTQSGNVYVCITAHTSGVFATDLAAVKWMVWAFNATADPELAAIAGLGSAADTAPYFTGSGSAALMSVTAAARSVLDDTTVGAMMRTLGIPLITLGGVAGTNTITAGASPGLGAYQTNALYAFIPANQNTGAATLNIDGLGAKNILRPAGVALMSADLLTNHIALCWYDGTQFQLLNYRLGSYALDKDVTVNDVANTAVLTSVYSFTLQANTLGSSGKLRLKMLCDMLQNAGATLTISVLYGGTSLGSIGLAPANDANRRLLEIDLELANKNATNDAVSLFKAKLGSTSSAGTPGTAGSPTEACAMHTTIAENSATALTLDVRFQWSAASLNASARCQTAHLELVR